MVSEPIIESRPERAFLAIRANVNMTDIPAVLPPLIPEVFEWINEHNIAREGPAFFHYESMNNCSEMDVAVGALVKSPANANDRIVAGSFRAGRYAFLIFTGDYKDMKDGHMALEKWLEEKGIKERRQVSEERVVWGGRTEFYLTDPDTHPDPETWQTEIAFLLEDQTTGIVPLSTIPL